MKNTKRGEYLCVNGKYSMKSKSSTILRTQTVVIRRCFHCYFYMCLFRSNSSVLLFSHCRNRWCSFSALGANKTIMSASFISKPPSFVHSHDAVSNLPLQSRSCRWQRHTVPAECKLRRTLYTHNVKLNSLNSACELSTHMSLVLT